MIDKTVKRVLEEITIMALEIGGMGASGDRIQVGKIPVGGVEFIGVIIKNLPVSSKAFLGAKDVNLLLLIGAGYPLEPPLGCYVDREYQVTTGHFIRQAAHGAPDLLEKGWRWFCHGVGGFDKSGRNTAWKPGPRPEEGHNLATVLAASRAAINGIL